MSSNEILESSKASMSMHVPNAFKVNNSVRKNLTDYKIYNVNSYRLLCSIVLFNSFNTLLQFQKKKC